jgi:hypothetical protein
MALKFGEHGVERFTAELERRARSIGIAKPECDARNRAYSAFRAATRSICIEEVRRYDLETAVSEMHGVLTRAATESRECAERSRDGSIQPLLLHHRTQTRRRTPSDVNDAS